MELILTTISKLSVYARKVLGQKNMYENEADTASLLKLQVLLTQYLPWSTSAMKPSAIVKLINEVVINERKSVIEFGSGVSTVYIAAILKQKKEGVLYSVEHDKNWIEVVRKIIDSEGLSEFVEFVYAPLQRSKYSINELNWYAGKNSISQ